jgi:FtsZ-interacting cell division protein ZipA
MSTVAIIAIAIGVVLLLVLAFSFGRRASTARAAKLGRRRVEAADRHVEASGHAHRAETLHREAVEHRERAEHHLERADELDTLAEEHAGEAGTQAQEAARIEPSSPDPAR